MKHLLESIITYSRNFLLAMVNKKFLVFLFFLILSAFFWLLMALNETWDRELSIPVKLINVPKNVVITTPPIDTLRVTLRDKGLILSNYMYGEKLRPIYIKFDSYANKETNMGLVATSEIQKLLSQSLFSSTKIVSIKPDKLDFYYNYGLSKRVSIALSGLVKPGKGYYLSQVRFQPEVITIYASKHLLDKITHLRTEPLHITNFLDSMTQTVRLQPIKGVKMVPNVVRISLYPDVLTEESVEVPIDAINTPKGKILRTFPSRVKVIFSVGAMLYRNVLPNDFIVEADYNSTNNGTSDKCSLTLKGYPTSVSNVRLETNMVDYLVEQP